MFQKNSCLCWNSIISTSVKTSIPPIISIHHQSENFLGVEKLSIYLQHYIYFKTISSQLFKHGYLTIANMEAPIILYHAQWAHQLIISVLQIPSICFGLILYVSSFSIFYFQPLFYYFISEITCHLSIITLHNLLYFFLSILLEMARFHFSFLR